MDGEVRQDPPGPDRLVYPARVGALGLVPHLGDFFQEATTSLRTLQLDSPILSAVSSSSKSGATVTATSFWNSQHTWDTLIRLRRASPGTRSTPRGAPSVQPGGSWETTANA